MKKCSYKKRYRTVLIALKNRSGKRGLKSAHLSKELELQYRKIWKGVNCWVDREKNNGLTITGCERFVRPPKNSVAIVLPESMDFNTNYDSTVQYVTAIRKLVRVLDLYKGRVIPSKAYKLGSVNFSQLKNISTSAALVLTAEISKWDHSIRRRLVPYVDNWCEEIYDKFTQLGFFDLFENKPDRAANNCTVKSDYHIVKYVKGKVGDKEEASERKRYLKSALSNIVGSKVPKWTILHSGLSEAVTNVTHHAYPDLHKYQDPSWYLTGSYDRNSGVMKVVFYDQGIGIPNSLPGSNVWERVLSYFSKLKLPMAEQAKHSTLLKAAVSIERTRTGSNDRGKGLQDLLEFINEIGAGHMSLMSYHGLYKYTIEKEMAPEVKSESFRRPLCGTLIIWTVNLL